MHYETFLFTRNQRQDFTAFVRPARLTNKEVSTNRRHFQLRHRHFAPDAGLSQPLLLPARRIHSAAAPLQQRAQTCRARHWRHRRHRRQAGRIGLMDALASVCRTAGQPAQRDRDGSEHRSADSRNRPPNTTGRNRRSAKTLEPFVGEFLERRDQDRLFLPVYARRARDAGHHAGGSDVSHRRRFSPSARNSDVLAPVGAARADRYCQLLQNRARQFSQPPNQQRIGQYRWRRG